jgi:hypothetical protein
MEAIDIRPTGITQSSATTFVDDIDPLAVDNV